MTIKNPISQSIVSGVVESVVSRVGGGVGLAALRSDVVFENDYTTDQAQSVANIIVSPADGENQSTYDFAGNNTVTFNANRYEFDGADYFEISGGNTAFLNGLHKADPDWTLAVSFRTNTGAINFPILSTQNSTAPGNESVAALIQSGGGLLFRQYDGTTQNSVTAASVSAVSATTDYLLILSLSTSGSDVTLNVWQNSKTNTDSDLFSAWDNTVTANAQQAFRPLYFSDTIFAPSGSGIYRCVMLNTGITSDTDASQIVDYFNDADGRAYA